MNTPDIAISYEDHFSSGLFNDFIESTNEEGLNVIVEPRESDGVYAGLEWFLPTAIIVFIGKSYFDGFLKEAGRDHYNKLKGSLSNLTDKTMSIPRIEPLIIASSPNKIRENNPYTFVLSIYAESNDGNKFKLLLPKVSSTVDYTDIVFTFLNFLDDYHCGVKVLEDIGVDEESIRVGSLILVHMNPDNKKIEWLNPF